MSRKATGMLVLNLLKEALVFILRVIGIIMASILKLCGGILSSVGYELEKKLK